MLVITNEAGERFGVTRDPAGRVVEAIGFDGRRRRFVRDAAGREIETRSPSGRTRKSQYDAAGRLLDLRHTDGSFAHFGYDLLGRLCSVENEHARVELTHDADGLVCVERIDGHEVRSSHDWAGERIELATSLGTRMLISRDSLGRPQRLY
ncbi:MAG: hypothetical protein HC927_11120, partial [Deltaproteobacteria bacterium]|nr:hypothetical protein [Deltaproteobacteria bacterium]